MTIQLNTLMFDQEEDITDDKIIFWSFNGMKPMIRRSYGNYVCRNNNMFCSGRGEILKELNKLIPKTLSIMFSELITKARYSKTKTFIKHKKYDAFLLKDSVNFSLDENKIEIQFSDDNQSVIDDEAEVNKIIDDLIGNYPSPDPEVTFRIYPANLNSMRLDYPHNQSTLIYLDTEARTDEMIERRMPIPHPTASDSTFHQIYINNRPQWDAQVREEYQFPVGQVTNTDFLEPTDE